MWQDDALACFCGARHLMCCAFVLLAYGYEYPPSLKNDIARTGCGHSKVIPQRSTVIYLQRRTCVTMRELMRQHRDKSLRQKG